MIQEFVNAFMEKKPVIKAAFKKGHPENYADVVRHVIAILPEDNKHCQPDPERIHEIDDGDYQGILVYVVAEQGYQPERYWYVRVDYGSCSGCDTLEAIRGYSDDPPTDSQIKDYLTLALHIVQGLKRMDGDCV